MQALAPIQCTPEWPNKGATYLCVVVRAGESWANGGNGFEWESKWQLSPRRSRKQAALCGWLRSLAERRTVRPCRSTAQALGTTYIPRQPRGTNPLFTLFQWLRPTQKPFQGAPATSSVLDLLASIPVLFVLLSAKLKSLLRSLS